MSASQSPWWEDPGPDNCEFCFRGYYVEVGYHCVECDRPICPICVITVYESREVICPKCSEEGGS